MFGHACASGFCGCYFSSVSHLETAAYLGLLSQMFDWIFSVAGFQGWWGFFNLQYLFNLLCFVKRDETYVISDFFPPF